MAAPRRYRGRAGRGAGRQPAAVCRPLVSRGGGRGAGDRCRSKKSLNSFFPFSHRMGFFFPQYCVRLQRRKPGGVSRTPPPSLSRPLRAPPLARPPPPFSRRDGEGSCSLRPRRVRVGQVGCRRSSPPREGGRRADGTWGAAEKPTQAVRERRGGGAEAAQPPSMGPLGELSPAWSPATKKTRKRKFFGGNRGPTGASSRVLLSFSKALNPSVIVVLYFSLSVLDSLLFSLLCLQQEETSALGYSL